MNFSLMAGGDEGGLRVDMLIYPMEKVATCEYCQADDFRVQRIPMDSHRSSLISLETVQEDIAFFLLQMKLYNDIPD